MGTLLLKLAGPLQAWGVESRFSERKTRHEPTKSGVVGMLASALGRRREDSIEDLARLPFGVRIDQAGSFERDFQTAHLRKFDKSSNEWTMGKSLPLSQRYYLADAVFVAALEVPDELLPVYADAISHPAFPLYLGRRSCPPAEKILLAECEGIDLVRALSDQPWQAQSRMALGAHRHEKSVQLEVLRDRLQGECEPPSVSEVLRDVPVSFSQKHRRYEWRTVVHQFVNAPNPSYQPLVDEEHDPMSVLEGVS